MSEPRNAKSDLKQVREIGCLAEFSDFATDALPYWICRAEKLERALDRACHLIFFDCQVFNAKNSTEEWKEYFLEGDNDA